MNVEKITQDICNIIQAIYGDATRTALDESAAHAIVRYLEIEFPSRELLAAVVVAAGGKVTVHRSMLDVHLQMQVLHQDGFDDTIEISALRNVRSLPGPAVFHPDGVA